MRVSIIGGAILVAAIIWGAMTLNLSGDADSTRPQEAQISNHVKPLISEAARDGAAKELYLKAWHNRNDLPAYSTKETMVDKKGRETEVTRYFFNDNGFRYNKSVYRLKNQAKTAELSAEVIKNKEGAWVLVGSSAILDRSKASSLDGARRLMDTLAENPDVKEMVFLGHSLENAGSTQTYVVKSEMPPLFSSIDDATLEALIVESNGSLGVDNVSIRGTKRAKTLIKQMLTRPMTIISRIDLNKMIIMGEEKYTEQGALVSKYLLNDVTVSQSLSGDDFKIPEHYRIVLAENNESFKKQLYLARKSMALDKLKKDHEY